MIDPRGLTATQWCDFTALDLGGLFTVPILREESEWQRWAISVAANSEIAVFQPPDPRYFTDWREWAMRFIQAVPL